MLDIYFQDTQHVFITPLPPQWFLLGSDGKELPHAYPTRHCSCDISHLYILTNWVAKMSINEVDVSPNQEAFSRWRSSKIGPKVKQNWIIAISFAASIFCNLFKELSPMLFCISFFYRAPQLSCLSNCLKGTFHQSYPTFNPLIKKSTQIEQIKISRL